MRFCDLFISYEIGLKDIKNTIPFTKLPLYRKVFLIIFLIALIISGILLIFMKNLFSFIPIGLSFLPIIVFFIIDSRKNNLKTMLKEHYIPYAENRMNMTIALLNEYNISIDNLNALDMLIHEAKHSQVQCDYLSQLKKTIKTLGATIIPIIVFVAEKIGNATTQTEMLYMAIEVIILILLIFSLFFSLAPIIKHLLCRDYYKYDQLISDLKQIKLFYARKESNQ